MRSLTTLALCLLVATMALAETITTDFEGGINEGNWTFGAANETLAAEGGNPGGWISSGRTFTFAPILYCANGAAGFTGDYPAMGVTRISGDFITPACLNEWANEFEFTVLLRNNMGTPEDPMDDVYVYFDPYEYLVPAVGEGWSHYDFDIPSDFTGAPGELPDGWYGGSAYTAGDIFPAEFTFQDVISDVSRVEFWWLHPAYFALITEWEAGGDNITIEYQTDPVATETTTLDGLKAQYR